MQIYMKYYEDINDKLERLSIEKYKFIVFQTNLIFFLKGCLVIFGISL